MKCCFTFLTLLFSLFSFAQTRIAYQGFETSGDSWNYTLSTPACSAESSVWNVVTGIGPINPFEGQNFWGITDLNGACGGSSFENIHFTAVDLTGFRDVQLHFWYRIFEFDNGDDVQYELIFDGVSQGVITFFEGNANRSTNGWVEQVFSIPNTVNSFEFKLLVKQNGREDYMGLDAVELTGKPFTPCSELLISEYVEGTANNKFIEIYNPTAGTIDLAPYNLTLFVGNNTEPSGNLALSGLIPAYGTYLIANINQDLGIPGDLSTGSVVRFNGDDKVALRKGLEIIDMVGVAGTSGDFAKDVTLRRKSNVRAPNTQYDPSEWDVYPVNTVSDLQQHVSVCSGPIPEIAVFGNTEEIIDGSSMSSRQNGTFIGEIPFAAGNTISKEFTIKNTGSAALQIDQISITGTHASDFTLETPGIPGSIQPQDSLKFTVEFIPLQKGLRTAGIEIINNDASESVYDLTIQAESTAYAEGPVVISQYYEGSGNNKWVEITNTGTDTIPEGSYFLAIYQNKANANPQNTSPDRSTTLPEILPGNSILFRSTLSVSEPAYTLGGNELKSTVCIFTGDDVLIISTSRDEAAWEQRVDRIGDLSLWGENTSFVRRSECGHTRQNTGFDPNDWTVFPVDSVNTAQSGSDYRLGEFYSGATLFLSGGWTNGLPASDKAAVISDVYYTDQYGNLEVCALRITSNGALHVAPGQYLSVEGDLRVDGLLEIADTGSLYMQNDDARITGAGTVNIHKKAVNLKKYDYTYWTSLVVNARFDSVFATSNQNNIFEFDTAEFEDNDKNNEDDKAPGAWKPASGLMQPAKGYAVMAPDNLGENSTQEVVFSGYPNNGLIEFSVQVSEKDTVSLNNWNLIGNPYPSAIDAQRFLNDSVNRKYLGGSLYFWTHNTALNNGTYASGDYAVYNAGTGGVQATSGGKIPTGYIASGQGFFVNAVAGGQAHFTNAMRVKAENDTFYRSNPDKSGEDSRIWLELTGPQGGYSQVLIGFIKGATPGLERGYDAIRLQSNAPVTFYSMAGGKHLAIQGTAPLTADSRIKLGFESKIAENGTYTIRIARSEGPVKTQNTYLFDRKENRYHDLNDGPYEFSLDGAILDTGRFELVFIKQDSDVGSDEDISNPLVIKDLSNFIEIGTLNNKEIYSVKVYDLLGKLVVSERVGKTSWKLNKSRIAKNAVYLLTVQLLNDRFYIKRVLVQ